MAHLRKTLANLARLESPRLVLRECARDRQLRDASFEDLATEVQDLRGDRSPFAGRQRKVLGVLAEIRSLMSCFRKVDSLEGLAVCARHSWYWDELFGDLARALLEDAANDNDRKAREVLERALEIHADARSRVARLNQLLAAGDRTVFPKEPELIDDAFLDWMSAQARCRVDEAPGEVAPIWRIVEMLEFAGRIARELQRFQNSTPNKNGMYELRQPLPTRETLFWFVSPATHRKMEEVATRVIDGSIGLDNALIEIVRFVRKVRPPEVGGDKASRTLWGRSAFLQYVIRLGDGGAVEEALSQFRSLLDSSLAEQMSLSLRATLAIRYALAALSAWSIVSDWQSSLHGVVGVCNQYLERFDNGHESPGIRRDLLLSMARARRYLGEAEPDLFAEAIADFRKGLSVKGVRFERAPRGRALGDLASALLLSPAGHDESEVDRLYREALSLLDAQEFPLDRAGVLQAYAAFQNERLDGIRPANQEYALALTNEAISLVEEQFVEEGELTVVLRELLASLYLLQGNVIRSRLNADSAAIARAISSYHTGLRYLGRTDAYQQLRGLLRLGIAYAETERSATSTAQHSYDEAIRFLDGTPRAQARALIGRAEVRLEAGSDDGAENDVELAEGLAADVGDKGGVARCARLRAHLALGRARKPTDLRKAAEEFIASAAAFAELNDIWSAVECRRNAADCLVRAFSIGSDLDQLREARAVLGHAIEDAKTLAERHSSLGWRWTVSTIVGALSADLTWVLERLGEPVDVVLDAALAAKSRDLLSHGLQLGSGDEGRLREIDGLRRFAATAESAFWDAVQAAQPAQDFSQEFEILDEAGTLLAEAIATDAIGLLAPDDAETVRKRLRGLASQHDDLVLVDVTVGTWGTVVCLLSQRLGDNGLVVTTPLSRRSLHEVLFGADGWLQAYASRDRARFLVSTRELLHDLAALLWQPIEVTCPHLLTNARVTISPGVLRAVPVHAANVNGSYLFDRTNALGFVHHIGTQTGELPTGSLRDALLVMSDPEFNESKQLLGAAQEVAQAANILSKRGVNVTVVASVGAAHGAAAFETLGVEVPQPAAILGERPTPEWLLNNWGNYDLIVFSGHARSRGGPEGGLGLVDINGNPRHMGILEVLSSPALDRAPTVVLSACETALERATTGDNTSIASCLLRIGARAVLAAQWEIEVGVARRATLSFVGALTAGSTPDAALVSTLRDLSSSYDGESRWSGVCLWLR